MPGKKSNIGNRRDMPAVVVKRGVAAWKKQETLRNAEVAFITDSQKHPAEYWWERLCPDLMPLQEFMKRARAGRWASRREKYWDDVTLEVLRKSKYRAVNDRVKELQEIQSLRQDTLDIVTPKIVDGRKYYPVAPGSMEGMISAFVKLDQHGDVKRDAILSMIEPDLAHSERVQGKSEFSQEEMRHVARQLLQKRRQNQHSLLMESSDGSEEESEDFTEEKGRNGQTV